jgi:hypothetical protein
MLWARIPYLRGKLSMQPNYILYGNPEVLNPAIKIYNVWVSPR